ncbi:putative membrane protein [Plasmodium gaboni]|uniref:Putative membrane protein n=1 Tax=Plasmodium gaboni TaxID=647221 RepID=A0A151LGA1_9APIC|nr:putative membrane protein [Plasmodium gaboni]KYN97972.1 putative membrane protein [Plasmodium gaboni]
MIINLFRRKGGTVITSGVVISERKRYFINYNKKEFYYNMNSFNKYYDNNNIKYVDEKRNKNKKKISDINNFEENSKDLYFKNKTIEKKVADIKIKDSHNKTLFEYIPLEGRTNKVPIAFRLFNYIFLFILSSGVILIHVLPEINKEKYIRDLYTFQIYSLSSFLVFNGGFNSLFQLIQYAIPTNRKYKGLYNTLRFISSLIPLFSAIIATTLCEKFPRDSLFLLTISFITLLVNYYLLHIKCLIPVWLYKQYKIYISIIIINLIFLLLSEAQIYTGRKVSINVDY